MTGGSSWHDSCERECCAVIHIRAVSPNDITPSLVSSLSSRSGVLNLIVLEGVARRPDGDVVQFDVITATDVFDYLDEPTATTMLSRMSELLAPGGIFAISNLHPSDPSRGIKEWLLDWRMVYRDKPQVAGLLPGQSETSRAPEGVITYGWWRSE